MTEFLINVLWWLILLPFHHQECVCFCNITIFTRPCYLAMGVNCTTSLRSKFLASLCSELHSETSSVSQLRLHVGNVWAELEAVRGLWVNTPLHCLKKKENISCVLCVCPVSFGPRQEHGAGWALCFTKCWNTEESGEIFRHRNAPHQNDEWGEKHFHSSCLLHLLQLHYCYC